ncbi:hypothetical protein IWW39_000434 [Coemansia spiralis]|uniref:Uncharacterized protein n=1 Tax=Coemansia spiralis TaxID=417178 RepID=A0A9W8GKQ5_9FUNG|nr:hypothetical protein IWW39_000434 [Coemansia spiralis]
MTAADELSMLDSGRAGSSAFDPMHLTSTSSRSRVGDFHLSFDPTAPRDPPSLDVLAEMIKEEIRQASGLKQALDRVGAETNCIATRMSTLSMADSMDSEAKDQDGAKPEAQKRVNGKPKKQVRFVVPDDVRFRWLGIFQQPTESEDASGSDPESPVPSKSQAADTAKNSNVPAATVSSPLDRVVPPLSSDKVFDDAQANGQSADLRSASHNRKIAKRSSMDGEVSDGNYVLQPFTANSSVEAVYGGSRSDTRESSMLGSGASLAHSARGRHAQGSRSTEGLYDEKAARSRLDRLLRASEARGDKDTASDASGPNGSGSFGKYSTISGKNSRRIAAQLREVPHEYSDPGEPEHTQPSKAPAVARINGRSATASPPSVMRSAFAQPSLSTSKVTVSKQHSVSPESAAAQMAPPQNGTSFGKVDVTPLLVFRSGSAHDTASNDKPPGSSRRRNSLDGSNVSSRGALRTDLAGGSGDLLQTSEVPPPPRRSQPSGLFRRVTTTAALRKHNQPADSAAMGDSEGNGDDLGGSGIIGGTREFFKHRLRSRTHSNSANLPNGTGQANGTQANGTGAPAKGGAGAVERPRKRSDAEVKSRDSSVSPPPLLPRQPALPDHLQRVPAADRRGAAKQSSNSAAASAHHKLLPPRPPPSSSSSGTQGDVFKTPQTAEALHSQRKSHDGAMTTAARGSDEHTSLGRTRLRTSSADSAQQPHQYSTVRVARGQTDVSKQLRMANGGVEEGMDGERLGTRSRSRRNTGESASSAPPLAQPQPPRKFTVNVGRGERPTSANGSDVVFDPPPVPKLPAGSPLPPMSAIISPQEAAKSLAGLAERRQHPAGDVDSIDYHLRRLRPSNNKGRRSSFMTTISNMLGRKDY